MKIDKERLTAPGKEPHPDRNGGPRAVHEGVIAEAMKAVLAEIGENPQREGLLRTPMRAEKALRFLTSGYETDLAHIVNNALFTVKYDEMVIVKEIEFFSLCEH